MNFAVQSPEDLVNLALTRIGYAQRITNIFEGTRASRAALNVYAQTRDDLLRIGDWPFASRDIAGTVLKSAPVGGYIPPTVWNPTTNPPVPWFFEYQWPSDCLEVRAVKPVPLTLPNFSPQPQLFKISNDNYFTPGQRVILSNINGAVITYTGQIIDPTTMPPDFIEEFAGALAKQIAPLLTDFDAGKEAAVKMETADQQVGEARAGTHQG
jgi:hypothetical protein